MTISFVQWGDIGGHLPVEGPLASGASFTTKPGTVIEGDGGAEFMFCQNNVVTGYTSNQGDLFCWDSNFIAGRSGEILTTGEYNAGMQVGTLFLGGRTGESTSQSGSYGTWTYVFTPGLYGIWVQRSGASLLQVNSVAQPLVPRTTSTLLPGRATFATAATAGYNLIAPATIGLFPLTKTFTADALTGSTTLINANVGKYMKVGMRVTGTGIPGPTTAQTTFITAINGSTVTISQAATASNTGITVTVGTGVTSCTTLSGSPLLTNVPTIEGMYPNQTITGTGIPASTTILAITGTGGSFNILLSANATASANFILATATSAAVPNYAEVILSWPYFSADTV